MTTRVAVLDYGSGNLHSACRALEAAGASVVLSADHAELRSCQRLLLPGVGAFAACMEGLRCVGGDELVHAWVDEGRPLLGICVGHQVLFEQGLEHGLEVPGLGILPGTVERMEARRLPHMGWNTVQAPADSTLFHQIADERFYFVHSYAVRRASSDVHAIGRVAWSEHDGDRFVAAVEQGCVSSTQFHPEKSGRVGARLLSSWINQPMG
ncbi:imidazole glycerol phosphate synthase subunit HisH [Luteococcus sp. Sow4_B9]|uniref:imidazole glycerol phosphate synthase subunit HisH n=1 Tax=Luteococcus sp. Sow4_B9 TaxID=3438792 RepID=UPI003F988689